MKNYLIFFTIYLVIIQFAYSQTIDDIKKSKEYIWGYAENDSLSKADKLALEDLISQISVQVETEFENMLKENLDNDSWTLEEYTRTVVRTSSQAILQNCQRIVEENRNYVTVVRFLRRDEILKIFEERKERIFDYTSNALKAERSLAIGDALRSYYYALILLRSHPDMNSIRYTFSDSENVSLLVAIPQKIEALLNGVDFEVAYIGDFPDKLRKDLILNITYHGEPVQNLDYCYYTGSNYSSIESASDGKGVIELIGEQTKSNDKIRILIEYKYDYLIGSDPDLKNIKENTIPPTFFGGCEKWILPQVKADDEAIKTKEKSNEPVQDIKKAFQPVVTEQSGEFNHQYTKIVDHLISAIREKQYEGIRDYFTTEGFNIFDSLIGMGNVLALPFQDTLKIIRLNDEIMVRSVPMRFSFQNNNRQFTENVVFIFNTDDKISSLSFSLGDKAIADIVSKPERWGTFEEKYELIRFMENYKTAYCLKRISYIESIFADNALIIIGRILKEAEPIDNMYATLGSENIQYVKYNKETYIKNLRNNFARNEFVNIHFEDNQVLRKSSDDKIFGIQIAQHYYSSNYSDFGYLFLMIDLNDTLNPKIYVRTWQPQKNPDGSIYGLADFYF
jgi:hypothetical protein